MAIRPNKPFAPFLFSLLHVEYIDAKQTTKQKYEYQKPSLDMNVCSDRQCWKLSTVAMNRRSAQGLDVPHEEREISSCKCQKMIQKNDIKPINRKLNPFAILDATAIAPSTARLLLGALIS